MFSTSIKLKFVFTTFVLSIFERPLKTGLTIRHKSLIVAVNGELVVDLKIENIKYEITQIAEHE